MIILFRFHDHYDIALHNLKILKRFTPEAIYIGFYGGNDPSTIPDDLRSELQSVYVIPSEDPYWKWKNCDLCVRQWFKDEGHNLDFNHVHLAEWDLLTLQDLNEFVPEKGHNTLTYRFDYNHAQSIDWDWIRDDYEEWHLIKDQFKKQFGFDNFEKAHFGVMGGAFLCREFLKKYAEIYPPSYNNDEVRIGLYSKLWNIPIVDNGFYDLGGAYRTADDRDYSRYIKDYLMEGVSKGFKVLHPVRYKLDFDDLSSQ